VLGIACTGQQNTHIDTHKRLCGLHFLPPVKIGKLAAQALDQGRLLLRVPRLDFLRPRFCSEAISFA